jgi:predicted anti-sigma-YlaC factor YlaD
MKTDPCEATILSLMAVLDGETPLLSAEQTTQHLNSCDKCRMEMKHQEAIVNLLLGQKRRTDTVDLWPEIEKGIISKPISGSVTGQNFFLLLGTILVIYKLLEMIPSWDLGFLFKLVPVVFIALLFSFYKENPFKINTELKLEGESS